MDFTGEERRKFVRLSASVIVDYKVIDTQSVKTTQTKNISAGGICIIVYEEIEPETILDLKIYLPDDSSPIQAKGRVVWKKEFTFSSDPRARFDIGIEFLEIESFDRERISRYVFSAFQNKK
jgi:c-di-GMP-binding flagellar brake protein YcgR